jgi:hypothetical protein
MTANRCEYGTVTPKLRRFRREVAGQIHGVVKDSHHIDHVFIDGTVNDDMATAPPPMRDVETAEMRAVTLARRRAVDRRGR